MPDRGEVWQVDFGITQKVRPALVISIPYTDIDRALIGVIPHTTATRGSQFEVSIPTRWLSEGAFLVQGVQAIPPKFFIAAARHADFGPDATRRGRASSLACSGQEVIVAPREVWA